MPRRRPNPPSPVVERQAWRDIGFLVLEGARHEYGGIDHFPAFNHDLAIALYTWLGDRRQNGISASADSTGNSAVSPLAPLRRKRTLRATMTTRSRGSSF